MQLKLYRVVILALEFYLLQWLFNHLIEVYVMSYTQMHLRKFGNEVYAIQIEEMRVTCLYVCLEPSHSDIIHLTRYSKFQSVGSLTLHFPDNFGGDTSRIHYIGLKGEATQVSWTWFTWTMVFILFIHFLGQESCVLLKMIHVISIYSWKGMSLQQLSMSSCQILLITSECFCFSISLFCFYFWGRDVIFLP